MLNALKNYVESQSENGELSQDLKLILKLIGNVNNGSVDHIMFNGKSREDFVSVSINTGMALRSVKIDISKIVDMSTVPEEARKNLNIIVDAIQQAVVEAYNDAQNKIVKTIASGTKN